MDHAGDFPGLACRRHLFFVIIPTLNSLFFSLTDWAGYGSDFKFIWFANFERVFTDRLFANAIRNTAIWLALSMIVPVLAGWLSLWPCRGKDW